MGKIKDILNESGAIVICKENRPNKNDPLCYYVEYKGEIYRWSITTLLRNIKPWEFEKKTPKKYIFGDKNIIYRMFDKNNILLYIGKSKQFDYRLYSHFYKNPEDWKNSVSRMDFTEFKSEADMNVYEAYLIAKLKPIFNRDLVTDSELTFNLPDLTFIELTNWK